MLTILNLFGKSPFAPLKSHMDIVSECVHHLPPLFKFLAEGNWDKVEEISAKISKAEHNADLTKNDIRNHLPKSIFLPVDRGNLLDILSTQDTIADRAEDVAVLVSFKQLVMPESMQHDFALFLRKNIEAFDHAHLIIKELHELLETSFGGVEAEKVRLMVEKVSFLEHEVDVIQQKLLKILYQHEDDFSFGSFLLWQKIFNAIGDLSNLSEKLAHRVRSTLELK